MIGTMKTRLLVLLSALLAACSTVPPPAPILTQQQRADRWWTDVATLADDRMEGRQTGTPGYNRAAAYVIGRLTEIGLQPAGTAGFLQPVAFEEQFVDHARSSVSLVHKGRALALDLPGDLIISRGGGRRPPSIDAPLVFVGYGLHIPEAGHDDFAGIDLKGKIAVFVGGGPANISGALKSHARSERAKLLADRGAVGTLSLTTAKAIEVPWARSITQASQSGMYLADPALRDLKVPFFVGSLNTASTQKLFAHAGHTFAQISALADASKPLPKVVLKQSLRASVASRHRALTSPNVVARIPGSDRRVAAEHVVFSAHLDHLGIGTPIKGDGLYNGAMDNAAGIAGLLDIARTMMARPSRPRRSMIFLFVTAEEKGLLGSHFFALRPTIPKGAIVANLNFDMALPIFPLRSVIALGSEQSSLGPLASEVGRAMGLPLLPDPFPDRNSFIRSDQYSFIREGVPALAFKFGFVKGSPEAKIEQDWRSTRYHAPSDDLAQPIERLDAVRLHDFVAELGWRIANRPQRPAWNADSVFARLQER